MILGRIDFPWAGQTISAFLMSGLRWQCSHPDLRGILEAEFRGKDYSPADGEPGVKMLEDAAAYFHGTATWLAPIPPASPDRIY